MACRADSVKARPTSLDARRRLHEAGFSLGGHRTGRGGPADLRRLCPGVRRATCLAGGAPAQVRRSVATGIPSRARCCTRRRHSGRRRRLTAERASGHGHQPESGGDAFCGSVSADGQGRCDQRGSRRAGGTSRCSTGSTPPTTGIPVTADWVPGRLQHLASLIQPIGRDEDEVAVVARNHPDRQATGRQP